MPILGILILLGFSGYGLVTGENWMVSSGTSATDRFDLFSATGTVARLYSLGLLGGALAIFGWKIAYQLPRLNPWYDWITGTGCLILLVFLPWSYVLHLRGG